MNNIAKVLYTIVVITFLLACITGTLKIYNPPPDNLHVNVAKVETGNHLIDMTEVNVILLIAVVGAFILVR